MKQWEYCIIHLRPNSTYTPDNSKFIFDIFLCKPDGEHLIEQREAQAHQISFHGKPKVDDKKVSRQKAWESHQENIASIKGMKLHLLMEFGVDGWELVSGTSSHTIYLKREVVDR